MAHVGEKIALCPVGPLRLKRRVGVARGALRQTLHETLSLLFGLPEFGRPLVCTEWLHRPNGNTFQGVLPAFAEHRVGWYHWGLVAGRSQTYMPWGSDPGDPEPDAWQHDVFRPDGTPYDPAELQLVRDFPFSPERGRADRR